MSKAKSDGLFQLVKSLSRTEKRYFKLYVDSIGGNTPKKYIKLFDLIDQQDEFDEERILAKEKSLKPEQLSNMKAHLYYKVLQSMRLYHQTAVIEIQIRELIDFAQLLLNKSLYDQCANILKKAKKTASRIDNLELLLEILKWEKRVLSQTVGKDNEKRVNRIIEDVQDVNTRINNINTFTNLSVKLNSLYKRIGFIRNKSDYNKVVSLFNASIPPYEEEALSLNEKLNLYHLLVGYFFMVQNFEKGYYYAKKWVKLFDDNAAMIPSRLETYINSINNLMIAQYKLFKYYEFIETNKKLKSVRFIPGISLNENIRLKLLKYTYVHQFNRYFMLGDFDQGVALMNRIKPGLELFANQLDNHSRIILYYKTASLYFGNDNFNEAIQSLNKIINAHEGALREDVHSFARILNLICHYELGNVDVIDYYIRSTYRFLLKKGDMHSFQRYILSFLKKLGSGITQEELLNQFENLRKQLIPLEENPYEKRPFMYFDIISWLESKIQKKRISTVIKEKAMKTLDMN